MSNNQISNRLRVAREQSGLSRDYVVAQESIGISRTTLQQWENGATEPSISMIFNLSKLYKVSPQYIIFGNLESIPVNHANNIINKISTKVKKKSFIGNRIRELREQLNLTRNELANILNISLSALQNWEINEREPQATMILDIAKALKTDPQYLLTGDNTESLQKNIKDDNQENKSTELKKIPFYKTFASAGFGSINKEIYDPDDWVGFSPNWLNSMGIYSSKLALIMTAGDSMQPTIHNNDIILINMQEIIPKDGNIYVVRQGDQLWVKRVQGIVGGIRLISDNKEVYQPIDINFHENLDFEIIGQVVCVLHSFI